MRKLILVLALMGMVGAGCGDEQLTQRGAVDGSAVTTTTAPVWLLNPGS